MQDAVIFTPKGFFLRHKDNVEELKPGKFFENSLLPIELEGSPLLYDFFRAIENMKKHEVKTLGQMARMNIFDFLAEMEKETKEGCEEIDYILVHWVGDDCEVRGVGPFNGTSFDRNGNLVKGLKENYSIEFFPVNVIAQVPIVVDPQRKFTALQFITTLLWFIGWYPSPAERDKEYEALCAKAKENRATGSEKRDTVH